MGDLALKIKMAESQVESLERLFRLIHIEY